jgi:DNA-binding beta-propeller fold protein YncE
MQRTTLVSLILLGCHAVWGQVSGAEQKVVRPGVKEVQFQFASLKPSAMFKVGGTADWVLITDDAVWLATTKPYSVVRINPATNRVIARVRLPGEACSGLAAGFESVWIPVCGKKPALLRVDAQTNKIIAVVPVASAGPEGGITTSDDSVWILSDSRGTLNRIDPVSNAVVQRIAIPPGSFNPLYSDGIVWITGFESNVLTAVEASTGELLSSILVGPKPRFLTAGGGSVWTLNQGDGTVSRVDERGKKVTATIIAGMPGHGGDIDYGADSVWATVEDIPLTLIDARSNKVVRQWIGAGGDSVRCGHGSIWLTDYHRGLVWRFPLRQFPYMLP